MIDFCSLCAMTLKKLQAQPYFTRFKLLNAFEPFQKPTVPEKPAIVCGISQVQAQTAALGGDVTAGSVTLFADIYAPFTLRDFDFQQAAGNIFKCLCTDTPVSIGADQIRADDDAECFVMRLTITFHDELKLVNNDTVIL